MAVTKHIETGGSKSERRRRRRRLAPLAVLATLPLCAFAAVSIVPVVPADAQLYGPGLGQTDLIRQVRETARCMREYRKTHDHLPQMTSELDDLLMTIYKEVTMNQPDPQVPIQSLDTYRTYANFAITYDTSIGAVPIINGQIQVPDQWSAPPGTVVAMSDGQDRFVVWVAAINYKPMADPTTGAPLVIVENLAPQPDSQ